MVLDAAFQDKEPRLLALISPELISLGQAETRPGRDVSGIGCRADLLLLLLYSRFKS